MDCSPGVEGFAGNFQDPDVPAVPGHTPQPRAGDVGDFAKVCPLPRSDHPFFTRHDTGAPSLPGGTPSRGAAAPRVLPAATPCAPRGRRGVEVVRTPCPPQNPNSSRQFRPGSAMQARLPCHCPAASFSTRRENLGSASVRDAFPFRRGRAAILDPDQRRRNLQNAGRHLESQAVRRTGARCHLGRGLRAPLVQGRQQLPAFKREVALSRLLLRCASPPQERVRRLRTTFIAPVAAASWTPAAQRSPAVGGTRGARWWVGLRGGPQARQVGAGPRRAGGVTAARRRTSSRGKGSQRWAPA